MRVAVLAFVWLWCFAVPFARAAAEEPQAVGEERLRAAYAEAQAAVEAGLGERFEPRLEMKLVDSDVLAKCIAAENLPTIRLRQPDEERARAEAELAGRQLASFAYAKYAWSTREFLVVPATWERAAKLLERPALTADATLRAVMVHELIHALDDRRHDLAALLARTPSLDGTYAFNALIEGHAQHHARRICAERGWGAGFDALTDAIGALPRSLESSGEAVLQLLRYHSQNATFAYHDGERFVAAVAAARGETEIERLFREPPSDGETILHPGWWLDPSTRPAVLYDAEPALDRFVGRFDAAIWSNQRLTLQSNQVETSLALLPSEERAAVLASLRHTRAVSLYPTAAPNSKIAVGVVLEFADEHGARRWIETSARLSRLKDEAMKTGVARITGSTSTALERPNAFGWLQQKQMRNGFLEFEVDTIDLARGKIVVETLYSGDPPPDEEHVALALELLDLVKPKP